MSSLSPNEQAIAQLCTKAIALQDTDRSEEALAELRVALHQHLADMRDKVADLAFIVAAEDEASRAA